MPQRAGNTAAGPVPVENRVLAAGSLQVINAAPPAGGVVEPAVPDYLLHLLLRSAPLLRVGFNRRPRWIAVPKGSLLLAPPDTDCEYVGDEAAHVLTVAIPKSHVQEFNAHASLRIEVRDEATFCDPLLVQEVTSLWRHLAEGRPGSALRADQVLQAILERLALRSTAPVARKGRERLANPAIRRVREFVETRLPDDLDVAALAAAAGLSPAHFARAFAVTVGMTPYRYVMMRRLARARELLERTTRPALDIALDVGFKTPSHFTSRFRREFGVTPRALRPSARRVRERG